MAISDEIKQQTDKFKDMTKEQKRDYIWTYYKWWIIGAVAGVIIIISLIRTIIENSKPLYLQMIFLNSDYGSGPVEASLEDDFAAAVNVDREKENIIADYSCTLTNEFTNQAAMAGQTKLLSLYKAEEVDIVCGPEAVMTDAADIGGYMNFSELFTKEELAELEARGYEFFVYTEKIYDEEADFDSDGKRPYTDGESYIAGIYIDKCDALINKYGVYSESVFKIGEAYGRYVLMVGINTPRADHAKEFIKFITE